MNNVAPMNVHQCTQQWAQHFAGNEPLCQALPAITHQPLSTQLVDNGTIHKFSWSTAMVDNSTAHQVLSAFTVNTDAIYQFLSMSR